MNQLASELQKIYGGIVRGNYNSEQEFGEIIGKNIPGYLEIYFRDNTLTARCIYKGKTSTLNYIPLDPKKAAEHINDLLEPNL